MSEWGGDVVDESHNLSIAQVNRLLKMTKCLQNRDNLEQLAAIKDNLNVTSDADFAGECVEFALTLWDEFTEEEQIALWIAPTYGGIFTTEERKKLRPLTTTEE